VVGLDTCAVVEVIGFWEDPALESEEDWEDPELDSKEDWEVDLNRAVESVAVTAGAGNVEVTRSITGVTLPPSFTTTRVVTGISTVVVRPSKGSTSCIAVDSMVIALMDSIKLPATGPQQYLEKRMKLCRWGNQSRA